jgi:hypothetical protein
MTRREALAKLGKTSLAFFFANSIFLDDGTAAEGDCYGDTGVYRKVHG